MENPLAEILEIQGKSYSRRMPFDHQCGWFAALKCGVSPHTVSLAAEIAPLTAIYLRRAGDHVGGQVRYRAVLREYQTLGHEAFVHRYLTPGMRDQLRAAAETLRVRSFEPLNAKGYSPRANRMEGRHEWPKTTSGKHVVFRIECHHERGGYFWRDLRPYGEAEISDDQVPFKTELVGDPERGPEYGSDAKGYARSQDCWRHVKSIYDPKEAF